MSHIDFSGPSGVSSPSARSSQSGRSTGADLAHPDPRPAPGSLRGIPDRELLSRVKELVSRERAVTLEVLVHLIEVERRRLHPGLGYSSMFDYCTRHLGYSKSAAGRRIHAARCIRDYPEVYGLLEKNEVNLMTLSLIASILNESNASEVMARIKGKSQEEVEEIVATYRPPVSMRDRAKPVCVAVAEPVAKKPVNSGQMCPITPTTGSEKTPNTAAAGFAGGPLQATTEVQAQRQASTQRPDDHPTPPSPRLERKFQIQFLASERFMKKFEKARALLSNKNGKPSYEAVLEAALDEFLKDHDPESRVDRREARKQKAESRANQGKRGKKRPVRSQLGGSETRPARDEEPSRHIPASTRDEVFKRDKRRCTYVGSNGERCDATHHLQIDHIVPYARGGTNSVHNLRLLCERHNKLEAERVYGANAMKRFRARE